MPATITPLLTIFTGVTGGSTSTCDAITDWSGSPVLDTINVLEGAGCLSKKVSNSLLTFVYTLAASLDLSATHIYAWMLVTTLGKLETKANGGLRIRVEDASANFAEWYVGGKDTYTGGWRNFVADTTRTPDRTSASAPAYTAITKVGVAFIMAVSVTGNVTNCFWDVLRYGSGLKITGATSGTPGTFQDVLDAEASNFYGVLRREGGVLFCSGELVFGDTAGSGDTYFEDFGQVLIFEDKLVKAGLYKIKIQANAAGTISVKFGAKVGSGESAVGNAGVTFRSASKAGSPFRVDCSGTNIDLWGFYGCTFQNGDTTVFDQTTGNVGELIGTSWQNMAQADIGKAFTRRCTFSGYTLTGDGALLWNESIDIKNCQFLANTDATNDPAAIEHPSAAGSPYSYDALTFSGNDYDVNNTSGSAVTINIVNTPTGGASTSKGSGVTFSNPKTLILTGIQSGSEARLYNQSTNAELAGNETVSGGITQAVIASGGGSYTLDDILTVSGGTFTTAGQLKVTAVSGGVITAVSIETVGAYTVNPANPVSVTGGTGSGATFTLTIGGTLSYQFSVGSIVARAFVLHLNYVDTQVRDIALDQDRSIPVQQRADRNYANP